MTTKDEYIYAAVLSHISWQQIATGPTYRMPELRERVVKATGVDIPTRTLEDILQRMSAEGFADIIDTGVVGTYVKIKYKPIYEYVTVRAQDPSSPEYIFRAVGKRLLSDLMNDGEKESELLEDQPPPPPILTEENRGKLVVEIGAALIKLDGEPVSNEIKAQANSLLSAARSLSEAPEPPVPLIWELLSRANALAGIASLLVAIVALFGR